MSLHEENDVIKAIQSWDFSLEGENAIVCPYLHQENINKYKTGLFF